MHKYMWKINMIKAYKNTEIVHTEIVIHFGIYTSINIVCPTQNWGSTTY